MDKPKRKVASLPEITVKVMRQELDKKDSEIRALETKLRQYENENTKRDRRVRSAEEDAIVLFDAIRILASGISATTAPGRRTRQMARQTLESREIVPPHTLGSSRNRSSKNGT